MEGSVSILVVEDGRIEQKVTEAACRNIFAHAFVRVAVDAADGIEAYQELVRDTGEHPDLVLTDLNMPMRQGETNVNEAGLVVVRVIHKTNPKVPIVVVSGVNDPTIKDRTLKLGATDFLEKNEFKSHRDLEDLLRKVLPDEAFSA